MASPETILYPFCANSPAKKSPAFSPFLVGSLVPITGFANSIVAPSMEYKSEGYVMGVGAKMFTVAGPVLVYGISTAIIVGIAYLLFNSPATLV